jgi:hypothetical protein
MVGGEVMARIQFAPGQIVSTEGALEACDSAFLQACLMRHLQGDWGTVPPEDAAQNNAAIRGGDRIMSAYEIASDRAKSLGDNHSDNTLWIITEADRSVTTFLLPSEY